MEPKSNYELLILKIDAFIRRYYLNKLVRGVLCLTAVVLGSYGLIVFLEFIGDFNSLVRSILFYGFLLLNFALFCLWVLPPFLSYFKLGKVIGRDEAARIIGAHFTDIGDKLLNTLQLREASHETISMQLIDASINQKTIKLQPVRFPSAVQFKRNLKYIKWVAIPFILILIIAGVYPSLLKDSTQKIIEHNRTFLPKAPFSYILLNRDLSVVQGEDFVLKVKLRGNDFPESVYIETAGGTFKMKRDKVSAFSYIFHNVQNAIAFVLTGDGFPSQEYSLQVNPKPSLLHLSADIVYPGYLERKSERVDNVGDLELPIGTVVNWHILTKDATKLVFDLNKKNKLLLRNGDIFVNKAKVFQSGYYSLKVFNDNVNNGDSISYRINVIPDLPPTIFVNESKDSVSSKALYFTGTAQDDHGFSSLIFHCSVKNPDDKSPKVTEEKIKADFSLMEVNFFYFWDLTKLDIAPGAEVRYYFQVADNNGVTGYQIARTPEKVLSIPDAIRMQHILDSQRLAVNAKMENALKMGGDINKDIEKLKELLLNKASLSYDDKQQILNLLNKRKDLKAMIDEARLQNRKNELNATESITSRDLADKKQDRMDELLKQLSDPKADEMIKKLEDLLNSDKEKPSAKDFAELQMNDQATSKKLDRTLDLLKQFDVHHQIQESADRLKQLSDRLAELAKQTKASTGIGNKLKEKQEEINRNFNAIKKSLEDAVNKNSALDNAVKFDDPKTAVQEISNKLTAASNELGQNNKEEAQQQQKEGAKSMNELAMGIQNKLSELAEQDVIINGNSLKSLIKNLVQTSFSQENIIHNLDQLKWDDPVYAKWVQEQKTVQENMKTMEDSLLDISKRLPEIESTVIGTSSSLNEDLRTAVEALGNRQTNIASKSQQAAMTEINDLALMLSESLHKMEEAMTQQSADNNGGSSSSHKGKTLLQLSEMQQKLNANLQAMRQKMQQEGSEMGKVGKASSRQGHGGEMSEQFARMARQQSEIRQAIERLNEEQNKDGSHRLGNLGALAKDMERTETDLVNKRIDDATMSRQLQIRTRLLQANKSDQQREEDNKREAKAPEQQLPPGFIPALQAFRLEKAKRTELLRTAPASLNEYYKVKVSDYFNKLRKVPVVDTSK